MYQKKLQSAFFIGLTIIVLTLLFLVMKPYFSLLFVSSILAVSFYPLYKKIVIKFNGQKSLAAIFSVFLIFVFVITPISLAFALLLQEAVGLYNSIAFNTGPSELVSGLNALIQKIDSFLPVGFTEPNFDLGLYTRDLLSWVIGHFNSVFAVIFGGILNFFLMLITLYYLFIYGEEIKKGLVVWSPLPDKYDEEFAETLRFSIDSVLRGRILVSVAQGFFVGLGFYVFGVGSPVLWGFIGGLASLVPIIGTSIVIIPAAAFLLISHHIYAGIGLLIWGAIIVGLVDNFISIIFFKDKIKIHPLIVLFSILGGVEIFGPIGFLVGPVVVSAFLALIDIYPYILPFKISEQSQ